MIAAEPNNTAQYRLDGDPKFLERLRQGDLQAYALVYRTYRPNVRRYIRSRTRRADDVEDLTQDTFLQAFRSIGRFEGRSSLLTWLLGIARFVSARAVRTAKRWMIDVSPEDRVADTPVDSRVESRVGAAIALERCVDLVERDRKPADAQIFHLRYFEHLPLREIALRMGKKEQAVKVSLRRSRQAIAERFGPEELARESA